MRICELKIPNWADREKIILALANSGYMVSVEERKLEKWGISGEHFVIVEDSRSEEEHEKEVLEK